MNYKELAKGEPQYDVELIRNAMPVRAVYVKSPIPTDNGNPYIEALPNCRDQEEVFAAYNVGIAGYNREAQLNLNDTEKIMAYMQLKQVRFMLPFHAVLEKLFYTALLTSYRARRPVRSKGGDGMRLSGSCASAANAGLTLLGYSGCGKSAALEILLSRYPQIIEHESDSMYRFTQIVYLAVCCPANSNLKALYTSIAQAIDDALDYDQPVHVGMMTRRKSISEKAALVCTWIENYGIGCIVLDEIQDLDFTKNKESSFESLLTIVNNTKVALMAVGTEEAYRKMFPNLRTSRRVGPLIEAHAYCGNKEYFATIARELMRYQWFDDYVEPTPSIIRALYEETRGVIEQLVSIYTMMHQEYFNCTGERPKIDAEYVHMIANKYFPGTQRWLKEIDDPFAEEAYREQLQAEKKNIEMVLEESIDNFEQDALSRYADPNMVARQAIKNNVIKNIQKTLTTTKETYNQNRIIDAVGYVMGLKKNLNADERKLTEEAYARLKRGPSDKRARPKKKATMDDMHIALKNGLLGSVQTA